MFPFWEIAGLILSVVQMGLYLAGIDKYEDKLQEFAEWLCECAENNRVYYNEFRDCDPDFYEYYKSLELYSECQSNVNRGKGAAFYEYGSRLRSGLKTTRGFTPLTNVHLNTLSAVNAPAKAALSRATTCIAERKRVDEHILNRWAAIVSAPVGVERHNVSAANGIIQQSFSTLRAFGQGFNSAGALFGQSVYRILN